MTISRNGFQTEVQQQPAPAVTGDFATMNPRSVVAAGPGALIADPAGSAVLVGNFAWGSAATGYAYGAVTANSSLGFVANELQTVLQNFTDTSRLQVQPGFPVTLYLRGDFWAFVAGPPVAIGAAIYADATNGNPTTVTTGGNVDTGFKALTALAADTTALTCSLAAGTGVLTVGTVTGSVQIGANVSGTGMPANVFITGQLTGTAGAAGTYQTNTIGPAVASFTGTFTVGKLVKIGRAL